MADTADNGEEETMSSQDSDMELEWIRVKEASGGKKTLMLYMCRNNEWFSASHCAAAPLSLDEQERGGEEGVWCGGSGFV